MEGRKNAVEGDRNKRPAIADAPPLRLAGTKATAQRVLPHAELTVSSLDGDVICLNYVGCLCSRASAEGAQIGKDKERTRPRLLITYAHLVGK